VNTWNEVHPVSVDDVDNQFTNGSEPMLLDEFTPYFDFALGEHVVVDAPPEQTYRALGRRGPAAAVLGWARPLGASRPHTSVPAFEDLLRCGRWVVLGESRREIVLGAAGRFWTPAMDWQQITPGEFSTFSRPRRGTIAVAFSVLPYGLRRSLLTLEIRSTVADPVARRWAEWYWHTTQPAARLAAKDTLHAIRDAATGPRPRSQP
jgi:hypothetical protein